jgi:AbrB family looped-hinge helix DNA binding protein
MSEMLVRVQEKGQVTIPAQIRKKLKLNKGDLVIFEETEAGVMIRPAEVLVSQELVEIGKALQAKGVTLDEIIERGRELREKLIKDEYRLDERRVD